MFVPIARRSLPALAVLCAAFVLAVPIHGREAPADEVRGLWVVRTSMDSPAAIATMVATARQAGFNTLLVQVRGRGEAYYTSTIEPRASALPAGPPAFDPLAYTIAEAHRVGLKVHAWVNVNLVASAATLPTSRAHVIRRHPEWAMVPRALAGSLAKVPPASPAYLSGLSRWTRDAPEVEGIFLSPLTPEARAYSISVIRELAARYAVDGVHLDYMRFPNAEFDYSARAIAAFRAHVAPGLSAADRARLESGIGTNPLAWTTAHPAAWVAFRQAGLTSLVEGLQRAVRDARPGALVSAAVFPNTGDARTNRMQDWPAWAARGWLDAVCPMIYTTDADEFAETVEAVTGAVTVPVWAGIGAYRLPASRAAENVRAARRLGAAGVLLFSYDSLSSASALTRDYFAALRPVLLEPANDGLSGR